VNGAGGAVEGAMGGVGARPENIQHVPVLGGNFRPDAMSTALSCVINLTIQYMLVYTALALVSTFADVLNWNMNGLRLCEILEQAKLTVNYAPMLACLFLACRMRVNWLSQGKGNPPTSVQVCMLCCTYAVLAMTLVALVVPVFTGKPVQVDEETGDIQQDYNPFENRLVAIAFTVLKYLIMIGLYVGVVCIIYGIMNYTPPAGTWPGNVIPPPAPAVACTMILTVLYFLVYAFIQLGKTITSFFPSCGDGSWAHKITEALQGAVCTMAFAPMLSVLFIGARMRALQMDPINGQPQAWAQNCFYACTYGVMLQCILAITVPLVMGGTVEKGDKAVGDVEYEVKNPICGSILAACRWIVMIGVYLGFTCVIWSIFTIEHPAGPQNTPPLSVTMQCVVNLTVQYFTVYLLIWVCATVKECTGWDWHYLSNAMNSAINTVAFCPMLAILFVGTRMRALRLTNNRGAPQGWVQDGMYLATWAVLIQFLMVLFVPVASFLMSRGQSVEHAVVDSHGNTSWEVPNGESMVGKILMLVVQTVRWLGFVMLYGGALTVIVGAITMTPETANGRGSLPLVRQTPLGQEPLGANDLPGMPERGGPAQDSTTSE